MDETSMQFWSDRSVFVTGATGFIGAHVGARLVELGAQVIILRRDDVPTTATVAEWLHGATIVRGSVTDQPLVERALGEYEVTVVLHLAAQSQVGVANRNPVGTFESNIAGTWTVLEAARRSSRIEAVVLASSDKAYGSHDQLPYTEDYALRPVHPYDVSKACADLLALCYGRSMELPVAVTRCGNIYGPGDLNWARLVPGTIRSLLREESPVIRSDGSPTRDYLYVSDAVDAYLCLAERLVTDRSLAGQAFNFSLGRPVAVLELVRAIGEAVGAKVSPTVLGGSAGEIPHQWLSSDRAKQVLGWEASWDLPGALDETVTWYRAHLGF